MFARARLLTLDLQWRPGIGDPTVAGWITVCLYFVTAGLAIYLSKRGTRNHRFAPEGRFWFAIGTIFGFLGLNKQLDLQSAITEIGRILLRLVGWYEYRIVVQLLFVSVFASLLLVCLYYAARAAREFSSRTRIAMFGIVILAFFIAVRAASFHHVDSILGLKWSAVRLNNLLEIGGIVLVLTGAIAELLFRRPVSVEAKRQKTPPVE